MFKFCVNPRNQQFYQPKKEVCMSFMSIDHFFFDLVDLCSGGEFNVSKLKINATQKSIYMRRKNLLNVHISEFYQKTDITK